MKKRIIIALLVTAAIVGACCYAVHTAWDWPVDEAEQEVAREFSPDGKFEAILQQNGEPCFFGPTPLRIVIRETQSQHTVKMIDTHVKDDGARLSPHNWKVVWQESQVDIILKGSEQQDVLHTVFLAH